MGRENSIPTPASATKDIVQDQAQEKGNKDEEVVFSKEDQEKMQEIRDSITELWNQLKKLDKEYLSGGNHSATESFDYEGNRRKIHEDESELREELDKLETKKDFIENFDESWLKTMEDIEHQITLFQSGAKESLEPSRKERLKLFLEICERKKSDRQNEVRAKLNYLLEEGKKNDKKFWERIKGKPNAELG